MVSGKKGKHVNPCTRELLIAHTGLVHKRTLTAIDSFITLTKKPVYWGNTDEQPSLILMIASAAGEVRGMVWTNTCSDRLVAGPAILCALPLSPTIYTVVDATTQSCSVSLRRVMLQCVQLSGAVCMV